MKLEEICNEIIRVYPTLFDDGYPRELQCFYEDLVFGFENKELNNSLELHEPSGIYYTPRKIPLTGNENIIGDFFLFDYDGHSPQICLLSFKTQEELIEHLLSDGCILNIYCTAAIPIINGKAREYTIEYLNMKTHKFEILDLRAYCNGTNPESPDEEDMFSRRVVWLDKFDNNK